MTIQIPNPGTGNGATGDNEFVLWSKVKDNFEDQTNAASKLLGATTGRVPTADQTHTATDSFVDGDKITSADNCDDFFAGTRYCVLRGQTLNTPQFGPSYFAITTRLGRSNGELIQVAEGLGVNCSYIRTYYSGAWRTWSAVATNQSIYNTTTASGANVVVNSAGELQRSTSSERYKDILADLELDDAAYANAMQLAPIVYRSTAEADNPDYHYYSFSAEKLGAYDPAFTLWRDTETVTDDEGNTIEQPLDERVAEGINLNAIVAFLHATNVKQGKLIAEQAAAIGTLTNRIDNMAAE
ncbi:hypothetical protein [Psychrobacter sp. NPDC078501]|uniref:hypothetical protein n=1 Tax=Psychrobacter sp. NPDC078501 TaxID=3364495 RepID=UPI00384DB57A